MLKCDDTETVGDCINITSFYSPEPNHEMLYWAVREVGGYEAANERNAWHEIARKLDLGKLFQYGNSLSKTYQQKLLPRELDDTIKQELTECSYYNSTAGDVPIETCEVVVLRHLFHGNEVYGSDSKAACSSICNSLNGLNSNVDSSVRADRNIQTSEEEEAPQEEFNVKDVKEEIYERTQPQGAYEEHWVSDACDSHRSETVRNFSTPKNANLNERGKFAEVPRESSYVFPKIEVKEEIVENEEVVDNEPRVSGNIRHPRNRRMKRSHKDEDRNYAPTGRCAQLPSVSGVRRSERLQKKRLLRTFKAEVEDDIYVTEFLPSSDESEIEMPMTTKRRAPRRPKKL